jgi:hypothetical protein
MPKFPAEANDTADVYELRAAVATVATAGNQPTCSPKISTKTPFPA